MKNLLLMLLIFFAGKSFSQISINTTNANSTLSVNGSLQASYKQVISSYTLTINDHYLSYTGTADATITLPIVGTGSGSFSGRIYRIKNISSNNLTLTASSNNFLRSTNLTGVTSFVILPGYYIEVVNNTNTSSATWDISFLGNIETIAKQDDATRFLGGTIYARFNSITGGTLPSSRVINGNYAVGTNNTNVIPKAGGINSVVGLGYTVSNPSAGIFDIKFSTPYTQIYGISVNIVDAYITVSDEPNPLIAGSLLLTNDNAMVGFVSNNILRIKTGNQNGTLSNRPFTFLVTGQ